VESPTVCLRDFGQFAFIGQATAVSSAAIHEVSKLKQDYLQMRVLELAPQVYASAQLFESDLQLIAKQGVRSIVNTEADSESPRQPKSADLAKAAEGFGITFVHFPVDPVSITAEVAQAFMKACDELERPLLVCGRSGAEATRVWETAEVL
jgi:uncharacterized protein (TIGR01244 family)